MSDLCPRCSSEVVVTRATPEGALYGQCRGCGAEVEL